VSEDVHAFQPNVEEKIIKKRNLKKKQGSKSELIEPEVEVAEFINPLDQLNTESYLENLHSTLNKTVFIEDTTLPFDQIIQPQAPNTSEQYTHEIITQDTPQDETLRDEDNITEITHTTDDVISPQSSDNEKTEEIVTKFERSPDGRDAKKVTTKRTILRKKGKKTASEYSPSDKNNGDVIIEEMWDDDNQDVKPDKMSPTYDNISIEECEPNTEEFNSQVNERATVEFEDDEKLAFPECSEVVNIEEIFPENEKIKEKIILSKPFEESSTSKIVKKVIPKKKKGREEKIETVTSYNLEDDLMTSVIIENEYYIEPLDSPINIKRKKSTSDTKKLTKMGLVPCKIEHKQQIAKKNSSH